MIPMRLLVICAAMPSGARPDEQNHQLLSSANAHTLVRMLIDRQNVIENIHITIHAHLTEHPDRIAVQTYALKGMMRYESFWHLRYGTPENDPTARIQVYDGKNWTIFWPFDRRSEVTERFAIAPYLEKLYFAPVLDDLMWWPQSSLGEAPRRSGRAVFLADVLNEPALRRHDAVETVDGRECVVIEVPSVVRLWVDDELLVRRRENLRASEDGSVQCVLSYEYGDFHEVSSGVVLPHYIVLRSDTHSFSGVHRIVECSVNDLGDDVFQLTMPPGTLVLDRDTDSIAQLPGGTDVLEKIAKSYAMSEVEVPPQKLWGVVRGVVQYAVGWFVVMSVATGVGGYLLACYRVRRRMRSLPLRRAQAESCRTSA